MVGRRQTHLVRRNGVFYFRASFPRDLQPRLRRVELRHSLRTSDPGLARTRVQICGANFAKLCSRLRAMSPPTAVTLQDAVRAYCAGELSSDPPPPPCIGPDADQENHLQDAWAHEQIALLESAIRSDDYSTPEEENVSGLMAAVRRDADALDKRYGPFPAAYKPALLQGVARARIEVQRQVLHRRTDRVMPYEPVDPLFASAPRNTPAPAATRSPTFEEATAAYIAIKLAGRAWTKRTEEEIRRMLGFASEHFGGTTPIAEITKDQVRALRDDIVKWRRKPPTRAKLKDLSAGPTIERIGPVTASKYFQFVAGAFRFWVDEGYLTTSPVGRISVKVPKGPRSGTRTSFANQDLEALFSSPIFVGCASKARRTIPGRQLLKDGYYWVPLVGALSGMRLSEIVQLLAQDVEANGEVPCFTVQADAEAGQSVKTSAGWRVVPIHRRLIELGFLDFVRDRQRAGKRARIFADVPLARVGTVGGEYSKWFGRRMAGIGLKRPGLVFHSFRHRFVEELRELNAPAYVIKAIVGHEGVDTTDGYGRKVSASACKMWVDKITMLDALPPLTARHTRS